MASEQSIPLGDDTQATSSKPKKSSGKRHSADNFPSEPKGSRTIEDDLASLKEEVRGLQKRIEEFLFKRLFTEGHYRNFERIDLGEGKYTKESMDEKESVDKNQAMFSKPTKSSGKKCTYLLSELESLGPIGLFTSLFEEGRGLLDYLFAKTQDKNLGCTDLGEKEQCTKQSMDGTRAMFSKPKKSSGKKHSADNVPSELKSSRTIEEDWTSLLEDARGLQKRIEGCLFTEKHDKNLGWTDFGEKWKYTKESMDETQAMFSKLIKSSGKKHTADNLPSELKNSRTIEEAWTSLLEEVHGLHKRIEWFQLKSKYTEKRIEELAWPMVSGQWILDNYPPELESSTYIDFFLASFQKEARRLQKTMERHLAWTNFGAEGKSTKEPVDEAGWLAIWLAKQEDGESHLVEETQRLDLEYSSEEIDELLEESVEGLQLDFERWKLDLEHSSVVVDELLEESVGELQSNFERRRLDLEYSSEEVDGLLEELQSDFERRLEILPPRKQHTIYRLPSSCSEEPYFTPQAVSIGPYHHGKTHLAKMECHKHRFVQDFLLRNPGKTFKQYCHELKMIEPQVRKYYSLKLDLNSASFVEMMLLDGCFILELLFKFYYGTPDEIFTDNSLSQYIKIDLMMFANQIPFMVLLYLHKLANTGQLPCIYRLLVYYFWDTSNGWPMLRTSGPHHLLHFYHLQFIPPFVTEHLTEKSSKEKYRAKLNPKFVTQVPSAEQLEKAGVIFRGKRTLNFLDIEFQDGVLAIPTLSVDQPFLVLLANLSMFEKLNIAVGKVVQTYCCFMHCLLKNPYDVQLLRANGVIEKNAISDEELLGQLGRFQNPDYLNNEKHYFADLFVDLWEYCEKAEKNANVQETRVKYSFFVNAFVVVAAALLYHIWIQYYL